MHDEPFRRKKLSAETLFGYAALSRYHPNSRQKAFVCANMPCRLILRCNVRTRRVLMKYALLHFVQGFMCMFRFDLGGSGAMFGIPRSRLAPNAGSLKAEAVRTLSVTAL